MRTLIKELSDADRLNQELIAAVEAEQLLENAQFSKSIETIKSHVLNAWLRTQPLDVELREKLHQQYKAVVTIEGILRATIEGGTLAAEEVEKQSVFSKAVDKVAALWQH